MFLQVLSYIPLWSLFNRVIYTGLYYNNDLLFKTDTHKMECITTNIISTYHSIKCLQFLFYESFKTDILFTYDPFINYNSIISYSISYFLYDFINEIRLNRFKLDMIFHHLMTIFCGIYFYSLNLSQLYLSSLFVELSNFNLNIKDIMDIVDIKDNKIYLINGILFSLTFFISRIAYSPIALKSAYFLTNELAKYENTNIDYVPIILVCSFTLLNSYWFSKIVKIWIYKYHKLIAS